MQDRVLAPAGLEHVGGRVTVAGTIIGEMVPGALLTHIPFLLPAGTVLVIVSTAMIRSRISRCHFPL